MISMLTCSHFHLAYRRLTESRHYTRRHCNRLMNSKFGIGILYIFTEYPRIVDREWWIALIWAKRRLCCRNGSCCQLYHTLDFLDLNQRSIFLDLHPDIVDTFERVQSHLSDDFAFFVWWRELVLDIENSSFVVAEY